MEGIPAEILDQHRNRIIQNFYQAQEDRRVATGNPLPGQDMSNSRKKLKTEAPEELKRRLEEFRTQRKNGGSKPADSANPPAASPASFVSFLPALSVYELTRDRTPLSSLPNLSTTNSLVSLKHLRQLPTATRRPRSLHDHQETFPLRPDSLSARLKVEAGTVPVRRLELHLEMTSTS